MLSDILPIGFECGVLNGNVQPGSIIAIIGAGPIGLAALLTSQFYSPAASFITCEDIVAPGGIIANIGVHGVKAHLHLERL